MTTDNLYYQTSGDETNQTLLLLHSGGMSSAEWQPFLKAFEKDYYVIRMDLPGHGDSSTSQLSVHDFASRVKQTLAAITEIKDKPVAVLGSSLGGATALTLALDAPEAVSHLVVYRMGFRKSTSTQSATENMADPSYWEKFGLDKWLSKIHQKQADWRDNTTPDSAWKQVITDVNTLMGSETTDYNHTKEALAKLAMPTLLVCGDRDPVVPREDLMRMLDAIPNAYLWMLPNTTHITAANTWRKEAFVSEINRFIDKG